MRKRAARAQVWKRGFEARMTIPQLGRCSLFYTPSARQPRNGAMPMAVAFRPCTQLKDPMLDLWAEVCSIWQYNAAITNHSVKVV